MPPTLKFRDDILFKTLDEVGKKYHQNYWFTGDRGTGKTLTCSFLANECAIRQTAHPFIIKCERTTRKTIESVADKLNLAKTTTSTRGIADKLLTRASGKDPLIIIDEMQDLDRHTDSFTAFDGFIFDLYEALLSGLNRDLKQGFSFIFSSQLSYTIRYKLFSTATLSRLQLHPVSFPNYNRDQLLEILKDRLALIQIDSNPELDEILNHIVYTVCSRMRGDEEGDTRKALNILLTAFIHANKPALTMMDVEYAIKEEKQKFWRRELTKISPHAALLLVLTAKHVSQDSKAGQCDFVSVHNEYEQKLKKWGKHCLSMKMMYYYLDYLEQKGWIGQETITQERVIEFGRKAYVKRKQVWLTGDRENILNAITDFDWTDVEF